jgi:hypothetical protein
MECLLRWDTKT